MKLKDWMASNGINGVEMGKLLGLQSPASVYRYVEGKRTPEPEVLRRIAEVTKDKVTANDFIHSYSAAEDAS